MSKLPSLCRTIVLSFGLFFSCLAYCSPQLVPCQTHGQWRECAAVDMESKEHDEEQKQFLKPVPGFAKIYLFRSGMVSQRSKTNVFLDVSEIAALAPNTYLAISLRPGRHLLLAQTLDSAELTLNVEDGKTYFIHLNLEMFFWKNIEHLRLTDELDARAKIEKTSLVKLMPTATTP